MPYSVISPPSVLPVTISQIKQHLRIDHDSEDELLSEIADAATKHVEAEIGQHLIERTIRQYVDEFSQGRTVNLEAWPAKSIEHVTGYDAAGEATEIDTSLFSLLPHKDPARLTLDDSFQASMYPNGMEIDYVSGFGATGLDIPSNVVRAILVLCAHWYEHRGSHTSTDQLAIVPPGLEALLKPVRRVRL